MDKKKLRFVFRNLDLSDFGYEIRLINLRTEVEGTYVCNLGVKRDEKRDPMYVFLSTDNTCEYTQFLLFEKVGDFETIAATLVEMCNSLNASRQVGASCHLNNPMVDTDSVFISVSVTQTIVVPDRMYEGTALLAREMHAANIAHFVQNSQLATHLLWNSYLSFQDRGLFNDKLQIRAPILV